MQDYSSVDLSSSQVSCFSLGTIRFIKTGFVFLGVTIQPALALRIGFYERLLNQLKNYDENFY